MSRLLIFQKYNQHHRRVFFKTLTIWVGSSERPRREIRQPSPVDLDAFLQLCFRFDLRVMEIKSPERLKWWAEENKPSLEEWFCLESDLAEQHLPGLTTARTCLTSPYGLFYDVDLQSPDRKRASIRRTSAHRKAVLERDGHSCVLCGKRLSAQTATLDHVIPYSAGGETTVANLVTMCQPCNQAKGKDGKPELLNLTVKMPGIDPGILESRAFKLLQDKRLVSAAYRLSGDLMCGCIQLDPLNKDQNLLEKHQNGII